MYRLLAITILIFILITFTIASVYAKTEINGKVIDKTNKDPIAGATIYIKSFPNAIYSDNLGRFRIVGIKAGQYDLIIVYPGFYKLKAKIKIYQNDNNKLTFELSRNENYENYRVSVTADRDKPKVSRKSISREEIKVIPGTTRDVVKAVITSFPGIVVGNSFASAFFIVRGGEPTDNRILFDNIWILGAFHFGGFVSIFNSDAIESIDFYAGGFPPGFGPIIGSVMDIHSTSMASTKITGRVNLSLLTADAFVEGPITDDLYFQFSTRRSYFDLFVPYLIDIEFDTFPFFWDYYGKITYKPHRNHMIDVSTIGSLDSVRFNLSADLTDNDLAQGNLNYDQLFYSNGINYLYIPNDKFFNKMTLAWLKYNIKLIFGTDPFTGRPFKIDFNANFFTLKNNVHYTFNRWYEIDTGPNLEFYFIPFELNAPRAPQEGEVVQNIDDLGPTTQYKDELAMYNLNYYVKNTLRLGDWKFVFGPEFNYYNLTKYFTISPRISFEYNFIKDWTLLGAWGLYFQNPQIIEVQREDDSVKSQWCYHYILGIEHQLTKKLSVKLEGYMKYYYNLLVFDHTEIERDTDGDFANIVNKYNNNGRGIAYGGELFIKHDLYKNFFAWLSYTYSISKRKNHPTESYRFSQYDQTHILTIIASYKFFDNWRIGTKWRLNSGFPYTPRIGRERITPQTSVEPEYIGVLSDDPYSARYPMKHTLDIRLDYMIKICIGELNIYLELLNAYDQDNVSGYRYYKDFSNYDSPKERYDLPRIPYLGLELKF